MMLNITKTIPNTLLQVYFQYITKLTPTLCNYQFTCSQYCLEVINLHGILTGIILTQRRLKACSLDGQYLRQLNIKTKHFNKGSIVPKQFSPITYEENIDLLKYISQLMIAVGLTIGVVFYPKIQLSMGFGISYLIMLLTRMFQERFYLTLKLNWILMCIALLPMLIISTPSLIFATLFNSIFEFSTLELIVLGDADNQRKKIGIKVLLFMTFISIFIDLNLASILALSAFLVMTPLEFTSKDRVLDKQSLLYSVLASLAFCFGPIYSLPFVVMWWQTKADL